MYTIDKQYTCTLKQKQGMWIHKEATKLVTERVWFYFRIQCVSEKNARRGARGVPQPVKLERRHLNNTVLVQHSTQPKSVDIAFGLKPIRIILINLTKQRRRYLHTTLKFYHC
jgi:hypothetical protein